MDSIAAAEKEIDKVIRKLGEINYHTQRILTPVIAFFERFAECMANSPGKTLAPESIREVLTVLPKILDSLKKFTKDHRDLHRTVRNFTGDFTATTGTDLFETVENEQLLNKMMLEHLYREGMDDVAAMLIKESGMSQEDIRPEPYAELHKIFQEITNRNLSPALSWTLEHSDELEKNNSSIEFALHRLAFMQILSHGITSGNDAIIYARTHFLKFVHRFQEEIEILMTTLLYLPIGIANSRYKYLMAPEMWIEAADLFIKDSCTLLGIPRDSPLSVIINAGCRASQNHGHVMPIRQVAGIWSRDLVPTEIDLTPEIRYHSAFVCPILREQTTEDNPPMKLSCGHVISREAMIILSNGTTLKCRFCRKEQSLADAKRIYF